MMLIPRPVSRGRGGEREGGREGCWVADEGLVLGFQALNSKP
jgi:hypothetical protein